MQMRRSAVSAAGGKADLLPSADLLPDAHGHAVFLHVIVSRRLAIAVVELDVICREGIKHRVHIKLAVVRFNHRAIERRENGNPDGLRGKADNLGVAAVMPIVSVIAPIVGQKPTARIDIDEVGREKIAKKISTLWVEGEFLDPRWRDEIVCLSKRRVRGSSQKPRDGDYEHGAEE
jgi:hypothetical protein